MIVSRHSTQYPSMPSMFPAFPVPHAPIPPIHVRSISSPSIANLTTTHYEQPVHTGPPPFSRSSAIRQAAQDPTSDDDKSHAEDDELEGDDGDDEDEDGFIAHQTKSIAPANTPNKRKGKQGDEAPSPRSGGDKRRRTRASLNGSVPVSARSPQGDSAPSTSTSARNRPPPIKPVGFAAGRESRRQSDGQHHNDPNIPSPVVMGFDFKTIDADQLKTVRETISIRDQQQALIAQRAREARGEGKPLDANSRDIAFRPWQPCEQQRKEKSVPQRAQQSRDAGLLTVNTAHTDKDVVLASRSAPMGQSLAAQQASRERESVSGRPPNMLPPIHTRNGHMPQANDLRTAPIDRAIETGDRPQFFRPSNGRYEVVPQTARPVMGDRQSFASHPGPPAVERHPSFGQNGHDQPIESTSPPRSGPYQSGSAARREFLAPFERMYDLLSQTESLKYALQDMHHRYETALSAKNKEIGEFKNTAHAASTLLNNLQQSADSLKDMVRYEISRAPPPASAGAASGRGGLSTDERQEFEDMKARMRKLEDALAAKGNEEDGDRPAKRRKSKGTNGDEA